jgi:hypothetical protein
VPEPTPTRGRQDNLVLVEGDAAEVESLRKRVAELEEELLRLRDDLIGKDAELGSAKGRITEQESLINRYESMRQHLEAIKTSRSWRLMWFAGLPIRKLRERKGG